jgi:hypothetical protein
MTDNDQERGAPPVPPPPRRRKAASPKRVPPPPRRVRSVAGASDGAEDPIATLIRQNQELLARIDRLESGSMRYIESEPQPKADVRVADPESLSDFQRTLLGQTHEVPENYGGDRELPYNYPLRWYMKGDGTFVQLQGDPKNRAYYQDKGYRLLSEAEVAHFLEVERPRLVKEQRQKAHLVSTIRNMFRREPSLAGFREDPDYDGSLNLMSISQLEDEWEDLRARSVNPNQKLPPLPRFRSDVDAEAKRMLAGIETTPPRSDASALEALEQQAEGARRRSRNIEVMPSNWNTFR